MKTDACVALGGKVSRLHAMWSSSTQGDASVPYADGNPFPNQLTKNLP